MPLVYLLPQQAVVLGHREEIAAQFSKQTPDVGEPGAGRLFPEGRFKSNVPDLMKQGGLTIPALLGVETSEEIFSSNRIAVLGM